MLVSDSDSADTINSNIRKNLDHIDFLAIDLRHFNLNLNQILENISTEQTRIIIMHYDQTMIKAPLNLKLDFISTQVGNAAPVVWEICNTDISICANRS